MTLSHLRVDNRWREVAQFAVDYQRSIRSAKDRADALEEKLGLSQPIAVRQGTPTTSSRHRNRGARVAVEGRAAPPIRRATSGFGKYFRRRWVVLTACLAAGGLILALLIARALVPMPRVEVTSRLPAGPGGPDITMPIAGTVSGVRFDDHRVVIYAFADGTWYVQPVATDPLTRIGPGGKWSSQTHLGQSYVALLVPADADPPATMRGSPESLAGVLAWAVVQGG